MTDTSTLTYALTGPGKELVWIGGGVVRQLVLEAAHPGRRHQAGLFESALPAALAERAASVAELITGTEPRGRGLSGPVVTATVRGRTVTTALDDPTGAVAAVLSEAIDLAQLQPASVVSVTAEQLNGTDVRVAFTARGTSDVDLLLFRETCRVSVRDEGAWRTVWSAAKAEPEARLALVARPAGFVDGVSSPAVLAPDVVARTMLPGALSSGGAAATAAVVEVAGSLALPSLLLGADVETGFDVDPAGRWLVRWTSQPFTLTHQ